MTIRDATDALTTRIAGIEAISDEMVQALHGRSGAERLKIANDMYRSARRMLLNHLRATHPNWTESQVEHEAARRLSHGAV
jgi:hypothetical protein